MIVRCIFLNGVDIVVRRPKIVAVLANEQVLSALAGLRSSKGLA